MTLRKRLLIRYRWQDNIKMILTNTARCIGPNYSGLEQLWLWFLYLLIYLFKFKNNLNLHCRCVQKDELWVSHFRRPPMKEPCYNRTKRIFLFDGFLFLFIQLQSVSLLVTSLLKKNSKAFHVSCLCEKHKNYFRQTNCPSGVRKSHLIPDKLSGIEW